MKLVFYSNYLNHHQKEFCDSLYKALDGGFVFVATEAVPEDRIRMGYPDYHDIPYVLKTFENEENRKKALKLGLESDVVIIGDAPDEYILGRLKENKLTFRYWERFFKSGRWHILDPRVLKCRYESDFRYRKKNLYMLCASAYTAKDCRFIFSYPKKTYRWGYFPPVEQYSNIDEIINEKKSASILWVGRLIKWKHPEDAIELAKKLVENGKKFHLNLFGEGEEKSHLVELVSSYGLDKYVTINNFIPPKEVRKKMQEADIYLFTSDQREGWGAVLNESMNSACAVVANQQIGSVPYLIEDGKNGLIYHRKKKDDLFQKVNFLLEHPKEKRKMQVEAYKTMTTMWNAKNAAKRLLHLIDCLQNKTKIEYQSGPCSEDFYDK